MTKHTWSDPVFIYESFAGFKCRTCGAVCFSPHEAPTPADLKAQNQDGPIPLDCEETKPQVEVGKFGWDQDETPPWEESDVGHWTWSDETDRFLTP